MKLSIRLQNHGKKNHPLWWIVIAPNRKNIFGRIIQQVGIWSPRQGVYLQRQIVMNIPRIKYWMSCGAVPTFKVQKFLSLWGILPVPWYYKKSEQELAKEQKPEAQLTDKQKRKIAMKQKRKARQALPSNQYYKQQARLRFMKSWKRKFETLTRTQERQNQILREMLLYHQFNKLSKIQQLSGKATFNDSEQLSQLKEALAKAKAELALFKNNYQEGVMIQQAKVTKSINDLCKKIREVQKQRGSLIGAGIQHMQSEDQGLLTQDLLKAKLEYELIHKKIEKNFEELENFSNLNEPVLLQQYADFLVLKKNLQPEQAYIQAQKQFIERGISGNPVIKYELVLYDDIQKDIQDQQTLDSQPDPLQDADLATLFKKAIDLGDMILPTRRTVHPVPDVQKYIPQDYYEPLMSHDFKIKLDDSLSPYEELQKYHESKKKGKKVVI